jgi:hypothetical protein
MTRPTTHADRRALLERIDRHARAGTLTVADELQSRRGCRYGLAGVPVWVKDRMGLYCVHNSRWDAQTKLWLKVYPASGPRPLDYVRVGPPGSAYVTLADFRKVPDPPGTLDGIDPADCTLAGRWPVVCCRPGLWHKYNRRRRGGR